MNAAKLKTTKEGVALSRKVVYTLEGVVVRVG